MKPEEIKSYEDACRVLGVPQEKKETFTHEEDWNIHRLRIVIKAANFLDNNNAVWVPDFDNDMEVKYLPYFTNFPEWRLSFIVNYSLNSYIYYGFYYKEKATAEAVVNNFITLYRITLSPPSQTGI